MTEHKCDAHVVLKLLNDKITSLTDVIETQRKFIDKLTTTCESQQDTIKKLIDNSLEKRFNIVSDTNNSSEKRVTYTLIETRFNTGSDTDNTKEKNTNPMNPPPSAPELPRTSNNLSTSIDPTQLCLAIRTIYIMYDRNENKFFIRVHIENCEKFPNYIGAVQTLDASAWSWQHLDKYYGRPEESAVYAMTLEKYERFIKPYIKIQPVVNMLSVQYYFKKMIKRTTRVVGGISIEFESAIEPIILQAWSLTKNGIIYNESNFTLYTTQGNINSLGLAYAIDTSAFYNSDV